MESLAARGRTCERQISVNVLTRFAGARVPLLIGLATVSVLALSGCMSSPTYGTDKTANQQLIEDLTGVLSLAPKSGPQIAYQPRPELVKPETTAVLPPPQDSVTTASSGAWPESPEQRRARLRQEATENQDNPAYRSPVVVDRDGSGANNSVTQAQQAEFRRRMAIQNAADPASRRYLSEPPVEYRQASATAPQGELGEDEWKKERDAKRAARAEPGKRTWWPW
jgi:hypothetical protein